MKVISLVHEKGGVGKTTLAINIAASLERIGKTVILFDTDPQRSLTEWYSVRTKKQN
jgi:ATPases involved in chromosome partitioning